MTLLFLFLLLFFNSTKRWKTCRYWMRFAPFGHSSACPSPRETGKSISISFVRACRACGRGEAVRARDRCCLRRRGWQLGESGRVARLLRELKCCCAYGLYHVLVSVLGLLFLFTCPAHGFYKARVNYNGYLYGSMNGILKPIQIAIRNKGRL